MKNRKTVMVIAALCMVTIGACFSPWDGSDDQGNLVINVGNGGARAVAGVTEYTIILTNSGETSLSQTTAGGTVVFPVLQPGPWNILVRAKGPAADKGGVALKGYGEADVEVKARAVTDVTVNVKPIGDATEVVSTWGDLDTAFKNKSKQTILITNNLSAFYTIQTEEGEKDGSITLLADKPVTITKAQRLDNSLFRVTNGRTLILGGNEVPITIDGGGRRTGQNSSLIYVGTSYIVGASYDMGRAPGTLEMNKGVTLTNNHSTPTGTTSNRGGAIVVDGGSFTMHDGIISGNSALSGGGVRVLSGTFTKEGGTIFGSNEGSKSNMADKNGQGHAVYYDPPINRAYNDTLGPKDNLPTP